MTRLTSARGWAASLALTCGLLLAACSPGGPVKTSAPAEPRPTATDPSSASALLRIAQVFNNEYDNGDFGAVYDRWDIRSQALISRAEYIRRHVLCAPASHETATVEGAAPVGSTTPAEETPGSATPAGSTAAGSTTAGSTTRGGGTAPAGGRAWHVRYEIAGQQLVDTWYYQDHRWVFDIIASNPGAARLYRMPFQRYVAAIGCSTH